MFLTWEGIQCGAGCSQVNSENQSSFSLKGTHWFQEFPSTFQVPSTFSLRQLFLVEESLGCLFSSTVDRTFSEKVFLTSINLHKCCMVCYLRRNLLEKSYWMSALSWNWSLLCQKLVGWHLLYQSFRFNHSIFSSFWWSYWPYRQIFTDLPFSCRCSPSSPAHRLAWGTGCAGRRSPSPTSGLCGPPASTGGLGVGLRIRRNGQILRKIQSRAARRRPWGLLWGQTSRIGGWARRFPGLLPTRWKRQRRWQASCSPHCQR